MFCAILRILQPHNGVLKPTEKGREIDPLTRHILNSLWHPPPPLYRKLKHQAKRKTKQNPLSSLHNTCNRSQAGRKQSTFYDPFLGQVSIFLALASCVIICDIWENCNWQMKPQLKIIKQLYSKQQYVINQWCFKSSLKFYKIIIVEPLKIMTFTQRC